MHSEKKNSADDTVRLKEPEKEARVKLSALPVSMPGENEVTGSRVLT